MILLRILDQIQQDNEDVRSKIGKSITTICKEEGVSFEQIFYICFLILHLLAINHLLAFRVEIFSFYFRPTDNSLNSLSAVIGNSCLAVWRDNI